jgi:glycerophosphoryl diester phosphodiesterase
MKSIPFLVGHRGASHKAPENTIPSYQLAFKEGADRIEGNFWLTSDARIICLHDPTTARTAPHQPVLDVRTSTLQELENYDVGLWKSFDYRNTRIPTLDQILRELPPEISMNVEIKQDDPRIITAMLAAAKKCKVDLKRLTLISSNEKIIKHAKQLSPELTVYLLHDLNHQEQDGPANVYLENIIEKAVAIGANGLDLRSSPLITHWFVDKIRQEGLEFHVWTVNNVEDALHYIDLGIDSITTDRPQGLRDELLTLTKSI